jgi:hypothetical protein
MKIKVQNLGALKQAEFTLGDLTIICGGNNTGKTYATYALFGFLSSWQNILQIKIDADKLSQLLADGVTFIDIQQYIEQAKEIVSQACKDYTLQLSNVFASSTERFADSKFSIDLDIESINLDRKFERTMRTANNAELFSLTKKEGSTELFITLLAEKEQVKIPNEILDHIIADAVKDIIFAQIIPNPFIASTERTGAAIFRKDLDFDRHRILEEMGKDKKIDRAELFFKDYGDYALPIKKNVEFIRNLSFQNYDIKSSFILKEHSDVLNDFANIIGGAYKITPNGELYYVPKGKKVRLSIDESSSAVRSLLDIGFYLRHEAQKGDLLMVDEPELNLHPENQRRVARLFARLVNLGIKVFITTHSDYIVKELNTLIMLNHDKPNLKRIQQQEGYRPEELISTDQIKVYIAEEKLIKLDGNQKKTKCQTLTLANIDSEMGIEARSFDITIDTMNRIQESIIWSDD